jgi:putative transposase
LTGLKKNLPCSNSQKKGWIDPGHEQISIQRQCELINLPRSSYYYTPATETPYNLMMMRLLDEQYTRTPFYGVPRMTAWLKKQGYNVNRKRIERLMKLMGLKAIYPKRDTSKALRQHEKYPYLLKNIKIDGPNQVWSSDITYIRLNKGFLYLTAIIDWHSRYILSWEISNTLDSRFCVETLEKALKQGKPEIFNTDQGVQFTSESHTSVLKHNNIAISMDGKGRALDNIMIERFWRSVKYEEVYLKNYETTHEAIDGLNHYMLFYNKERLHQALNYKTPFSVHVG